MKRLLIALLSLAVIGLAVEAPTAQAAGWSWCSSGQYASWSNGGYKLYNDVWGRGAGSQTICANSYSNWQVTANHPNTAGVKSYPDSSRSINRSLSSLKSVQSSFNVSVPSSGSYESAYDIWLRNNAFEVMLWMNKTGAVGPLGSYQTTVTVGGHTWKVYKGSNGSNQVFSFVQTSNTTSGTVDVLAVLKWIEARGWYRNETLGNVQFGFEITSSAGGKTFTANSYSVSSS